MNTRDEHDELKEAPLLRGIPRSDPFQVPDGFFDRFPQHVQGMIARPAKTGWSNVAARFQQPRAVIFGIAMLAVIATTWTLWPTGSAGVEPSLALAVEPEEVLDQELDDELLFAALDHDADLLGAVDLPLSDAELEAYLDNEEVPLDLLIEEL